MLRVALTGGVASGKSAAAAMLRDLGARVSQSDEIARRLMQPGQAVFQEIVSHFGTSIVTADGTLDRKLLGLLAFEDGRIEELNDIVHPPVIADQAQWLRDVGLSSPGAVAVVESALVFETRHAPPDTNGAAPWHTRFDRIVVVTADLQVREERYLQRVLASGSLTVTEAAADFRSRTAAQWTDERRVKLADIVLPNNGSLTDLSARVSDLYRLLRDEAADRAAEAM